MSSFTNNTGIDKSKKRTNTDEINLIPILSALLKKIWLIILVAIIVGGAVFTCTKFLVTPTYRASFTAYVNNKSQLNNVDTITGSDLTASQQLVRAYSETINSRNILLASASSINLDVPYKSLASRVSTQVQNETMIITVYVVDVTPEGAYNLARAIATVAPKQIANIIEGSSMKIIDMPQIPDSIYKPSYVKNTVIGVLLGALAAAAYIAVKFLLDDKVKTENELESRFSIPVVGVIPDMNNASRGSHNYYDYEYAYRNNEINRSGGRNGK